MENFFESLLEDGRTGSENFLRPGALTVKLTEIKKGQYGHSLSFVWTAPDGGEWKFFTEINAPKISDERMVGRAGAFIRNLARLADSLGVEDAKNKLLEELSPVDKKDDSGFASAIARFTEKYITPNVGKELDVLATYKHWGKPNSKGYFYLTANMTSWHPVFAPATNKAWSIKDNKFVDEGGNEHPVFAHLGDKFFESKDMTMSKVETTEDTEKEEDKSPKDDLPF